MMSPKTGQNDVYALGDAWPQLCSAECPALTGCHILCSEGFGNSQAQDLIPLFGNAGWISNTGVKKSWDHPMTELMLAL